MTLITRTEELILLAVWRLQDNAYGVTIRQHLHDVTGKNYSIGSVYVPLDKLVAKGYLQAIQGEPTPERGGMAKRFYRLTPAGLKVLADAHKVHEKMWRDLPVPMIAKG